MFPGPTETAAATDPTIISIFSTLAAERIISSFFALIISFWQKQKYFRKIEWVYPASVISQDFGLTIIDLGTEGDDWNLPCVTGS